MTARNQTFLQLKNIQKLFEKIPPEFYPEFQKKVINENLIRMRILNYAFLIWIIIMIMSDIFFREALTHISGYNSFFFIDLGLCIVIILFIIVSHAKSPQSQNNISTFQRLLPKFQAFIILIGGAVIAGIEYHATKGIPTFIIAVFIIGTIFHFHSLFLCIIFLVSCMVLFLSASIAEIRMLNFTLENLSIIGLVIFAWVNSRILAVHRIRVFLNQKRLANINEKLRQESAERTRIQKILEKTNNELENRVRKRTNALVKVNRDLEIEIQEHKQATEKIKASLKEKEILLKEVHHRVKNNLQVVQSLLSLQSQYIKDPKTMSIFREGISRIRSMALVHEALYIARDLSLIDMNEYISKLTTDILQTYRPLSYSILLKHNTHKINLPIDLAVPCGLIINELVTNAMKYAFPLSWMGKKMISIGLATRKRESHYSLTVKDNGVGITKSLDTNNPKSLGLQLVKILSKNQLAGEMKVDTSNGTKYEIIFGANA